jgi:hypothetical protein
MELVMTGRRVWTRPGGRVLAHDPDGWPLPAGHIEATSGFAHWPWGSRTDMWPCHWTHYQQVCQRMAMWRTVEHRGFATWRNFWCDTHLPHSKPAEPPGRTCDVCTGPLDPSLTANGQTTHPSCASAGNVTFDEAIATITNVFGGVTA